MEMMRRTPQTDASQPSSRLFPFAPGSLSDQGVDSGTTSNDSVGANRGGAKSSIGEGSGAALEMGWDVEVSDNNRWKGREGDKGGRDEKKKRERERERESEQRAEREFHRAHALERNVWESCVHRSFSALWSVFRSTESVILYALPSLRTSKYWLLPGGVVAATAVVGVRKIIYICLRT